jgi:hypothetical protein
VCQCHEPDLFFSQRRKAVAAVRTPVVSVPLPAQGGLVDVFTAMGQSYLRDIQRDLVPRMIARSGYRWHNAAARSEMIQILRYLTIRKGGVYIHWDALAARSHNLRTNNEKALAAKIAGSQAHAARNHQAYIMRAVFQLFQATPDDMKLSFVKQEVFGIADGGPIIGADHPIMTEVFAVPITGALCTYSNFRGVLARCFESADRCPGLAGNFQSKVLFETKGSEKLGETTVLQNRLHPSQQKIFDLLGTHRPAQSPRARTPESIRERSVDAATGNPVEVSCWQSSRV